jgi:hypothetical protein
MTVKLLRKLQIEFYLSLLLFFCCVLILLVQMTEQITD